jgi:hypothetical protein
VEPADDYLGASTSTLSTASKGKCIRWPRQGHRRWKLIILTCCAHVAYDILYPVTGMKTYGEVNPLHFSHANFCGAPRIIRAVIHSISASKSICAIMERLSKFWSYYLANRSMVTMGLTEAPRDFCDSGWLNILGGAMWIPNCSVRYSSLRMNGKLWKRRPLKQTYAPVSRSALVNYRNGTYSSNAIEIEMPLAQLTQMSRYAAGALRTQSNFKFGSSWDGNRYSILRLLRHLCVLRHSPLISLNFTEIS